MLKYNSINVFLISILTLKILSSEVPSKYSISFHRKMLASY